MVTEATPDGTEAQPDNADTRAMAYTPLYVNFDNLLQINPETEAWILLPDTKINYPIVKHTDNAYYLNHMIDGTSNSAGTLFIDTNNSNNFADQEYHRLRPQHEERFHVRPAEKVRQGRFFTKSTRVFICTRRMACGSMTFSLSV